MVQQSTLAADTSTTGHLQRTRHAWNTLATDFDRFVTPANFSLAEEALDQVGLRAGMRFLDVAAGSGALSIPAARRGARVLATDLSSAMVEQLGGRAREAGLVNIETCVMDGHALELEDDTFDIAASQHGVSLFPDMQRGLRELVRVTRPGGRVLIVAFGPFRGAEFIGFFMAAMKEVVPGFSGIPHDPPPLPFQVANPEDLRQRMTDAGMTDVQVEATKWNMTIHSGLHLWNMTTSSNPIAAGLVAELTEVQRSAVQQALDGMLRQRSGGSGAAVLTNLVNIGIGSC